MSLVHNLVLSLIRLGADLKPGVPRSVLTDISNGLEIKLPLCISELYLNTNGSFHSFGEYSWNFWSIDSPAILITDYVGENFDFCLNSDGRRFSGNKYIRLFDCLMDLPLYAVCCDEKSDYFGEVIFCSFENSKLDAGVSAVSVESFFEKFMLNVDSPVIIL